MVIDVDRPHINNTAENLLGKEADWKEVWTDWQAYGPISEVPRQEAETDKSALSVV